MLRNSVLFLLFLISSVCRGQEAAWWGYWNTSMPMQPTSATFQGTTTGAIRLTTANAQLIDGTVHGLRFWLTDKTVVTRVYAWVSQKPFTGGSPDVAMKEIALADLRDVQHDGGATVIMFDEPIAVLPAANRYASVYVGYTLETSAPCSLVAGGSGLTPSANSCYVNWERQEGRNGPLALQLRVSGTNIAASEVSVQPLSETITMAGDALSLACRFTVNGSKPVERFDCRGSLDGVAQPVQHFTLDAPVDEIGLTFEKTLTVSVPAVAKSYDCQVAVDGINGEAPVDTPSQHFNLIALSQRPLKRSVMEELTGTWCPNCPRGLVGMELLEEQFGDRFVGIAIHGGDNEEPMRVAAYDGSSFVRSVVNSMGGRPSCSFDRVVNGDPYWGIGNGPHFGANTVVGYLLEQPCVADIGVSAAWNAQQPAVIDFDVATTFRYSCDESAPYALALVLTADSLTGEGSEWLQVNTLVGKEGYDDDLSQFTQGERYMRLKYNHVPIDVKGVEKGIDGSISLPLSDGVAQHYIGTFDTTGNALVQHRDYLHVVALLLDTRSGVVVNAAKCDVGGLESGIREVVSRSSGAVYSLSGFRMDGGQLPKGIYVVDGKKRVVSETGGR